MWFKRVFNRQSRSIVTFATLSLLLGGATHAYSQDGGHSSSATAELRSRFLDAKRGTAKGIAVRRLIAGRSAQEIQALCFDDDPTVALSAAWQRLQVQMAARLVGSDRGATLVRLQPQLAREFLGFVEGRLHVPAGDQWSRDLQSARYSRWGSTLFPAIQPTSKQLRMLEPGRQQPARESLPQVLLSLESSPAYATFLGRESYEGEDAVASLPDEVIAAIRKFKDDTGTDLLVTGLSADGRAVIALPGDGPGSDELICMAASGANSKPKINWRYRMDSYWAEGFKGASWYTEMRFNRGLLYLFHCTHDSIGIECVKLTDGTPLFSFNSRLP